MAFSPFMKHSAFSTGYRWKIKQNLPLIVGVLLLSIIVVLLIAYVWSAFSLPADATWRKQLDLNREENFGAAFSASLLASCAIILWKITSLKKGGRFRNHWRMLGFIFSYFAADEWLQVHERVNEFLAANIETTGIFHYAWVIPGSLVVLAIAYLYRRFVTHLPPKTRRLFYLSGGLYVFGILGMEMLTGYYVTSFGRGSEGVMIALNGIEETLEMLGVTLFIYTLLDYLQSLSSQVQETAV